MGYTDKIKRLLALRGLDQSALASRIGLTKSSISRILGGAQEPKLSVAYELAKALGVTLDYLVDESPEIGPTDQLVSVSEDEMTILKIVRHLGTSESIARLLVVSVNGTPEAGARAPVPVPQSVSRPRPEGRRGTGENSLH